MLNRNEENEAKSAMLHLLGAIFLNIFGPLYAGFVGCFLWRWFVTPVFGLAPLRVIQAVGIMYCVAAFLRIRIPSKTPFSEELTAEQMLYIFVHPTVLLFFGWVFHFFL